MEEPSNKKPENEVVKPDTSTVGDAKVEKPSDEKRDPAVLKPGTNDANKARMEVQSDKAQDEERTEVQTDKKPDPINTLINVAMLLAALVPYLVPDVPFAVKVLISVILIGLVVVSFLRPEVARQILQLRILVAILGILAIVYLFQASFTCHVGVMSRDRTVTVNGFLAGQMCNRMVSDPSWLAKKIPVPTEFFHISSVPATNRLICEHTIEGRTFAVRDRGLAIWGTYICQELEKMKQSATKTK